MGEHISPSLARGMGNLGLSDAERLAQLDKQFFPPAARDTQSRRRSTATITQDTTGISSGDSPLLPPIHARYGVEAYSGKAQQRGPSPSKARPSPADLSSSQRSKGSASHQGGERKSRRKQHANSLLFGVNPSNPFETVVEASPAKKYLTSRDWRQLELLLPRGLNSASVSVLEQELVQFLTRNTSSTGARVDVEAPTAPLVAGVPLPHTAAAGAAAASAATAAAVLLQQQQQLLLPASAPPLSSSPIPFGPHSAPQLLPPLQGPPSTAPATVQHLLRQGPGSSEQLQPQHQQQPEGPGLFPNASFGRAGTALSTGTYGSISPLPGFGPGSPSQYRFPSPSRGAVNATAVLGFGGNADLPGSSPYGVTPWNSSSDPPSPVRERPPTGSSTATVSTTTTINNYINVHYNNYTGGSGQGVVQQPVYPPAAATAFGQAGAMQPAMLPAGAMAPFGGMVPAGYGSGNAAASAALAGTALAPGDDHITLGKLMAERQSVRRHAQLLADWLDSAVARVWHSHSQEVASLGARAELAFTQQAQQQQQQQQRSAQGAAPSPQSATNLQKRGPSMQTIAEDADGPMHAQADGTPSDMPSPLSNMSDLGSPWSGSAAALGGGAAAGGFSPASTGALQASPPAGAGPAPAAATAAAGATSAGASSLLDLPRKRGLAAQFAAFVKDSLIAQCAEAGEAAAASKQLWAATLQVVDAAAGALVQHVAGACYEEGALLARLWNLHTSLLDAGRVAAAGAVERADADAKRAQDAVRRLDPLIDWEREARGEIASLNERLEASEASLRLASSERDGLLRENDKIIVYYRKELRRFRHEQRKNAWKLARKLKNMQEQLALMQRDRERLIDAVSYTKTQAAIMMPLVSGVNGHFKTISTQNGWAELPAELEMIESGLKTIITTMSKVGDVTRDAEEHHFQVEERVTAVAAADTVGDDLVEQVLAGGDPDDPDASAANLSTDGAATLDPRAEQVEEAKSDAEEEEEEEDDLVPESKQWATPTAQPASERGSLRGEKSGLSVASSGSGPKVPPLELPPAGEPSGASAGLPSVPSKAKSHSITSTPRTARGSSIIPGATPRKYPPRHAEAGVQTDPELLEDLLAEAAAAAGGDLARSSEGGELGATPGDLLTEEEVLQVEEALAHGFAAELADVGIDINLNAASQQQQQHQHPEGGAAAADAAAAAALAGGASAGQLSMSASRMATPRNAAPAMQALVHGLQEKVHSLQSQLADAADELDVTQKRVDEAVAQLEAKAQELSSCEERLEATQSSHQQLRQRLKQLGVDPDSPRLPEPVSPTPTAKLRLPEPEPPAKPPAVEVPDPDAEADASPKKAAGKKLGGLAGKFGAAVSAVAKKEKETVAKSKVKGKLASTASAMLGAAKVAAAAGASSPSRAGSPTHGVRRDVPQGEFKLGKERVVEKKVEQTGEQRLQEAIAKYADIKPRTQEWLLKLIDAMYKGKMSSDETRAKMVPPQDPLPMADYMFQHLAGVYGTRDLVNQYAAQLHATIESCRKADHRVALFQKVLMELWPRKVLPVLLEGMKRLQEPARLPCCDYPVDWAPRKGGPPCVDIRKCLWVADKVLMRRHAKTAYTFAAALAVKGEAVPESELQQFFTAPGYYGPDVINMREYEKTRAEFRRIQTSLFLEAMCEEFLRCESVYMDVLPGLFKKWDQDSDGFMTRSDVMSMMEHLAPQDVSPEDVAKAAREFWESAIKTENEGIEAGLGALGPTPQPLLVPGTAGANLAALGDSAITQSVPTTARGRARHMVSIKSFLDAAQRADLVRAYVRLHKTPPAKLRLDNSFEEQARVLLFILINRHWQMHGPSLTKLFADTGATEAQLAHQVSILQREKDGARKALALHGLLKMMIGRKLDRIVSQLNPDSLANSVDPDFEDSLNRLTSAVKVLYGSPAILPDELLDRHEWVGGGMVAQLQHQKQVAQLFATYNNLRGLMREYAMEFICNHHDARFWAERWRARAARGAAINAEGSSPMATPRGATYAVEVQVPTSPYDAQGYAGSRGPSPSLLPLSPVAEHGNEAEEGEEGGDWAEGRGPSPDGAPSLYFDEPVSGPSSMSPSPVPPEAGGLAAARAFSSLLGGGKGVPKLALGGMGQQQ